LDVKRCKWNTFKLMNYYTKNISLNTYFLQPPRYVIGGISTNVENIESLSRFVKFDLNAGHNGYTHRKIEKLKNTIILEFLLLLS
jgi:hypothetical protein